MASEGSAVTDGWFSTRFLKSEAKQRLKFFPFSGVSGLAENTLEECFMQFGLLNCFKLLQTGQFASRFLLQYLQLSGISKVFQQILLRHKTKLILLFYAKAFAQTD